MSDQTIQDALTEVLRPHVGSDASAKHVALALLNEQRTLDRGGADDPVAALEDAVGTADLVDLGVDPGRAEDVRESVLSVFRRGAAGDLDGAPVGSPPVSHDGWGSAASMVQSGSEDEWREKREHAPDWPPGGGDDDTEETEGPPQPPVAAAYAEADGTYDDIDIGLGDADAPSGPEEPGLGSPSASAGGFAHESNDETDPVEELANKIEIHAPLWRESGDPVEIGVELCQLARVHGASLDQLEEALQRLEGA
jgi:hypothetical protein